MTADRYKLVIDYDGTAYSGWQAQSSGTNTIQGTIESCLSRIMSQRQVSIVGCGRTDAGVHAKGYVCHSDFLESKYNVGELSYKANKLLPEDIVLRNIERVDASFHARYDAISRSYEYRLGLSRDPFDRRFTARYPYQVSDLSLEAMQLAADALLGQHDFTAFCKTGSDVKTKLCTVTESTWRREGNVLIFRISADRYLRGMIRLVVGMCCNVSRGQLSVEEVRTALSRAQRLSQDWSMPARGLMLCDIKY